jgi:mono/diheme cytochrome c family protein
MMLRLWLALAGALMIAPATAQTTFTPRDESPEEFVAGEGRSETFYACTACHGFKLVAAQAMSRDRWSETLDLMVARHNMPDVQGADRDRLLDYLESAFPERREPGGWKNPFAPR